MPALELDMASTSSTYCHCQSAKPPSSPAALLSSGSSQSPRSIGLQNAIVKQIHLHDESTSLPVESTACNMWRLIKTNQTNLHWKKPAFEPGCCGVVRLQTCTIWQADQKSEQHGNLEKLQTRSPIRTFSFFLTTPPIICLLTSPIGTFWLVSREHLSKYKENPACNYNLGVVPGGLCTKDNGGITGVPCTKRAFSAIETKNTWFIFPKWNSFKGHPRKHRWPLRSDCIHTCNSCPHFLQQLSIGLQDRLHEVSRHQPRRDNKSHLPCPSNF